MINLELQIKKFIDLLCKYWVDVEDLINKDLTGSFKDDWLQANWELIVEGFLNKDEKIYLEAYGDGGDANGYSSRILFPDALPTHVICCYSKDSAPVYDYLNEVTIVAPVNGWPISKFVSLGKDGWYYEKPPFDKVLIENSDSEILLEIKELIFKIKKIHL